MRNRMNRSLVLVAALAWAGNAGAQSATTQGQAGAQGTTNASPPVTQMSSSVDVDAGADADLATMRGTIDRKAAKVSSRARAKADSWLTTTARTVDEAASQQSDRVVAIRLAGEFGTTADALVEEKQSLSASWGDLMIAHTLGTNDPNVTVEQLVTLHAQGEGWGQIAAGLGLDLGSSVSGVKAESRVALGRDQADAKVAVIHPQGHSGVGGNAGLHAGTGVGPTHTSVGAGIGVRVGK